MTSPYQIQITNQQAKTPVDEAQLLHCARETLRLEGIARAEISIAIVDDPTIHKINREHLQHDYPTDVISFLLDSGEADPRSLSHEGPQGRGHGMWIDGEIILSADTAVREAQEYGWDAASEMSLYVVHGLLHLCGYDDLTDGEQAIMRDREREILTSLGLSPQYSEDK
jgi:probable rRNA maturation factor